MMVEDAETETAGVTKAVTVIGMVLEVAVDELIQVSVVVMMQLTMSPSDKVEVVKSELLSP